MDHFKPEYDSIWKYCDYDLDPELIVLKGHLVSERYLERYIRLFLCNGNRITKNSRFSYSQKLEIVAAIGGITDDILVSLKNLNKIRNKMAHELDYSISIDDIDFLGKELGRTYFEFKNDRGDDLKNLLCTVIGFVCSGLAYQIVEYEKLTIERERLK